MNAPRSPEHGSTHQSDQNIETKHKSEYTDLFKLNTIAYRLVSTFKRLTTGAKTKKLNMVKEAKRMFVNNIMILK